MSDRQLLVMVVQPCEYEKRLRSKERTCKDGRNCGPHGVCNGDGTRLVPREVDGSTAIDILADMGYDLA